MEHGRNSNRRRADDSRPGFRRRTVGFIFSAWLGAPEHVTLPKLISWPQHTDPGVRFFSGTATYRTRFDIPQDRFAAGQSLHLNLGDVQVIAEVKLNGQDLGILWKPPFRVDVTSSRGPAPMTWKSA